MFAFFFFEAQKCIDGNMLARSCWWRGLSRRSDLETYFYLIATHQLFQGGREVTAMVHEDRLQRNQLSIVEKHMKLTVSHVH